MTPEELGRIVAYHRKRYGMPRSETSALAGIGKTALYDLEHGKPTVQLNTVMAVLNALGIRLVVESPLMDEYRHAANR
jgi:HTH-type transcriptional regulator / antitoxin HipB